MRDLKMQFGKRLRDLRKQKGMTQEQLAEEASISVDFLSLVERGINAPSFDTLEKLSRALNVPVKQLFDFDANGF
jgi:transcriptional regulator with XRE-family HTH domain